MPLYQYLSSNTILHNTLLPLNNFPSAMREIELIHFHGQKTQTTKHSWKILIIDPIVIGDLDHLMDDFLVDE